jgi:FkbM family methyltransferase
MISAYPYAVGSKEGIVKFYESYGEKVKDGKVVDRYYGSSSIRKPASVLKDFPDMRFKETEAHVITLDSVETPPVIDFIWCDIQGAELDMIAGGMRTLNKTRYLYTEHENGSYEGQTGLAGILEALPDWEVVEDYGGDVLLRNKGVSDWPYDTNKLISSMESLKP